MWLALLPSSALFIYCRQEQQDVKTHTDHVPPILTSVTAGAAHDNFVCSEFDEFLDHPSVTCNHIKSHHICSQNLITDFLCSCFSLPYICSLNCFFPHPLPKISYIRSADKSSQDELHLTFHEVSQPSDSSRC